jgi:hypothetical protein
MVSGEPLTSAPTRRACFVDGSAAGSLTRIRNIPRVFERRGFSPVGREVSCGSKLNSPVSPVDSTRVDGPVQRAVPPVLLEPPASTASLNPDQSSPF